jgi:hypothetical protein
MLVADVESAQRGGGVGLTIAAREHHSSITTPFPVAKEIGCVALLAYWRGRASPQQASGS